MIFAHILAGSVLAIAAGQLPASAAAPTPQTPASAAAANPAATATVEQLQAENQALKAEVARLRPLSFWQKIAKLVSFEPQGLWFLVGFFGQFVFFMRFIVQWIASERAKKSVVPVAFWYISLAGSLITIVYAVYIKDPVFTIAFCLNILIYIRNLYFIHRKPRAEEASAG
jgi:lipid-A-disaccharide synthase-like uncharacterized protein